MKNEENDHQLKCTVLLLAGLEQIDVSGKINSSELFERAKALYNFAHQYEIDKWKSVWEETDEIIDKPIVKNEEKKVKKIKSTKSIQVPKKVEKPTEKECPGCNEMVPEGWVKHQYTSKGNKCGYEWQ